MSRASEPQALPADSRAAFRRGIAAGFGAPGLALAASFIGFGALAREVGLSLPLSLLSTLAIWAVPGQMALAEMQSLGADLFAIVLAVTLINARFLPMALPLIVHLRAGTRGKRGRLGLYAAAHFVALTVWATGMRVLPRLAPERRLPWLLGFGLTCISISAVATVLGYAAASGLPTALKLALVFLNPLFFLLVFAGDVKGAGNIAAILSGAVIGLAVHVHWPEWSLLIGGAVGGTLAFLIGEKFARGKPPAPAAKGEP